MNRMSKVVTRFLIVAAVLSFALYGTQIAEAKSTEHPTHNTPLPDSVTTWYVATNGVDSPTCSNPASPCKTLIQAIENATDGDIILIKIGTYSVTYQTQLSKNLTISGGWNSNFNAQTGFSTFDGEGGIYGGLFMVVKDVILERLIIQNSNEAIAYGAYCPFSASATLRQVSIREMKGTAIIVPSCGYLTAINSTFYNNHGSFGAIYNYDGTVVLQNSTITNNSSTAGQFVAGGINTIVGTTGSTTIQNSIITGNLGYEGASQDCSGTTTSLGVNIIGTTNGCYINTLPSDMIGVDPKLGIVSSSGYFPIPGDSQAVDKIMPTACPSVDQRGISRPQGSACDIGAYEYAEPGPAASFEIAYGNNQKAGPFLTFPSPIAITVRDTFGTPVNDVMVTFTAPALGPSSIFATSGTNTLTTSTNNLGEAIADITANSQLGSYNVIVTVAGFPDSVTFDLTNGGWFVSPDGIDSNPCFTPDQPCLTINAAIAKATKGDSVQVAGGTYTSTSTNEVVLANKGLTLSGGWNSNFTVQNETTIIDGEGVRRGITALAALQTVIIDRFVIQNGHANEGGGISVQYQTSAVIKNSIIKKNNAGTPGSGAFGGGGIISRGISVLIDNSLVTENKITGDYNGSGIYAGGKFTINNSVINNNIGSAGIYNSGELTMRNSIVSGNSQGGMEIPFGKATIDHSTITDNLGYGGIFGNHPSDGYIGIVIMQNSILARNTDTISGGDCHSTITSNGYNIIGNDTACIIIPAIGDQIGTSTKPIDPMISTVSLKPYGHFALLASSPAIDTANPSTCPATDQRGVARPLGTNCDIGAFEFGAPAGLPAYFELYSGDNQASYQGRDFAEPLTAYVVDSQGTPVENINVTFTAPASAASGKFTDTFSNIAMTRTDVNGLAITPAFRANYGVGNYTIAAGIAELPNQVVFSLTNQEVVANYLQNGNFEDAILGNHWWQYSMQFGTPLCKFATCGNGGGIIGPYSGSIWAWFGGVSFPNTEAAALTQTITIPRGSLPVYLRFYLWIGSSDPYGSGNSEFFASVDNPEGRLFVARPSQQKQYPSYKMVAIDISKYADGNNHTIWLRGLIAAERVNYSVDDISVSVTTFGDVPSNYWAWQYIDRLFNASVTRGCSTSPMMYCPTATVTRDQMAVFLLRGKHGSSYTPPPATGTMFADVPSDYWAADWIEQLANEGITNGCGNGNYCPSLPVTRDQMAVFLLHGKHGSSYTPPIATGTVFADVPSTRWAADWIEQLANEGITGGCGGGNYCPSAAVTRDQMAVFLVRAFSLP